MAFSSLIFARQYMSMNRLPRNNAGSVGTLRRGFEKLDSLGARRQENEPVHHDLNETHEHLSNTKSGQRQVFLLLYLIQSWICCFLLLRPVHPRRHLMWRYTDFKSFDPSILDWLAFAFFQKNLLVSGYIYGAMGEPGRERLAQLIVMCLSLAELASLPYIVEFLALSTAIVQGTMMSFCVLTSMYSLMSLEGDSPHSLDTPSDALLKPTQRYSLAPPCALALQAVLVSLRLGQMFEGTPGTESSDSCAQRYSIWAMAYAHPVTQSIGQSAAQLHILSVVLLVIGVIGPFPKVQRSLLWGQALSWLGWAVMHPTSLPELVGSGAALLIAIIGALHK